MANRSYLYSLDFDRTLSQSSNHGKILGLSEYPYSIPLAYKILVSQQTKQTLSIIWDFNQNLAIQGDFRKGKEKLISFIHRLESEQLLNPEQLKQYRVETIDFLNQHELPYILLECGEIFSMTDHDLLKQNNELFHEIENIDSHIEAFVNNCKQLKSTEDKKVKPNSNEEKKSKNIISKLFSSKSKTKLTNKTEQPIVTEEELWRKLGIDYWSNVLYFDFPSQE